MKIIEKYSDGDFAPSADLQCVFFYKNAPEVPAGIIERVKIKTNQNAYWLFSGAWRYGVHVTAVEDRAYKERFKDVADNTTIWTNPAGPYISLLALRPMEFAVLALSPVLKYKTVEEINDFLDKLSTIATKQTVAVIDQKFIRFNRLTTDLNTVATALNASEIHGDFLIVCKQ